MTTNGTILDRDQIYIEYHPKVLQFLSNRLSIRYDAEDLAQTVFMKVYSKLDTFDPDKSSLSTWIFNITRNTMIDFMRFRSLRVHGELSETLEDDREDILDGLVLADEQERLADALERLSIEERDLIILRYYNEYTLMDIAGMMGRPYGQIKRLHVKALNQLKLLLGS